MIRYICFECQTELRPPDQLENPEELISHGLCRKCLEISMSRFGRSLTNYLQSFSEPVLVVDQDGRIITVNDSGQEVLSKNITKIEGYLGGQVFGCLHSREPGGCGETLHCLSCVVRNTVEETYKTGIAHHRIPACQDLDTVSGPRTTRFIISTEKIEKAVLLILEEIGPE